MVLFLPPVLGITAGYASCSSSCRATVPFSILGFQLSVSSQALTAQRKEEDRQVGSGQSRGDTHGLSVSRLSSLRDGVPFAEGFLGRQSSKGDHEHSLHVPRFLGVGTSPHMESPSHIINWYDNKKLSMACCQRKNSSKAKLPHPSPYKPSGSHAPPPRGSVEAYSRRWGPNHLLPVSPFTPLRL